MDILHHNIEEEILSSIVRGSYKDLEVLAEVDPGFFSADAYKWIVRKLQDRDWQPLAWGFLDTMIAEEFAKQPDKLTLYRTQLWNLYDKELTFEKDAAEAFKSFVVESIVKASVKASWDSKAKSGRVDYLIRDLSKDLTRAHALLMDGNINITDWAAGYKDRMARRIHERDNPEMSPTVMLGIPDLDVQMRIRGPQIINFLAPFKSYKSIALTNVAAATIMQGFDTLHVIFENSEELTADRQDSRITEISYDRLCAAAITADEKKRADDMLEWINSWDTRLKVMKCVSKKTTIAEIMERIDLLWEKEGWKPEVILLDYLNIVSPSVRVREENMNQQQVVWDIKGMVDKYGIPCITATQTNQEGNKSVKAGNRLDTTHQGKAIDISQGVDAVIGINQTAEEAEEGLIVLSLLLLRDGEISNPEVVLNANIKRMAISRDYRGLWDIAKRIHPYNP